MYDEHVQPTYSWWEEATKDDGNGRSKKFPDLRPIQMTSTGDMSATWKMLGKGRTAKIKTFFCHCCDCVSDEIHHNIPDLCDICEDFVDNSPSWRATWKCYHRQIMTSAYKDEIEKEYEVLKEELKVSWLR